MVIADSPNLYVTNVAFFKVFHYLFLFQFFSMTGSMEVIIMFTTKEFQPKAEENNEALSANIKQAEARVVFALINFIMTWRAKFPT